MDLSRQALLIPAHAIGELTFLIIGLGSIGSNVANVLSRMGASTQTWYDRDITSLENVAPAFSGINSIGDTKVDTAYARIQQDLGEEEVKNIRAYPYFYKNQREHADIVIVGVDSMEVRREIWANNRIEGWKLWIDGRMGEDQAGLYIVRENDDYEWYEESLARPGAELMCGEKATAPICAGLIPGMVGSVIMRYVNGLTVPQSIFVKMLLDFGMFFSVGEGEVCSATDDTT